MSTGSPAEDEAVRVVHLHRIGGIGGSERHLLTLLPALAARGIDVQFVGIDLPGADPFYKDLEQAEVPFERLSGPWQIAPAVRHRRPDVVHTHLVHRSEERRVGKECRL